MVSCDLSNELSDSVQGKKVTDQLNNCKFFKKELKLSMLLQVYEYKLVFGRFPYQDWDGKLAILTGFREIKRIFKIANSDYWLRRVCLSVCPSARMEQFGLHWTGVHEIFYLSVFRKSAEKIHVSLKSVKNNGYFTGRSLYICDT